MNINFDNIEYLQHGNNRQQQAYSMLMSNFILEKLKCFNHVLVGTIPINIDIERSDLDIICYFADKQEFQKFITENFSSEKRFTIKEQQNSDTLVIVASFVVDNFEIEIFGQNTPTKNQFAYRHMIVEHNLLNKYGEVFRQEIIKLKRQGHKTEPAFAIALDLKGDPYKELLKFETN